MNYIYTASIRKKKVQENIRIFLTIRDLTKKGKQMISKEKRQLIMCVTMCIVLIVCSFSSVVFRPGEVYGYTEKTGVVSVDDALNVRSGPGTAYSKIGSLTSGQVVRIVGESSASDGTLWYEINFDDGTGYVSSGYITNIRDVVEYTPDADFEAYLNTQGFPESYKDALRTLHAKYPQWVFIADHLDYEWSVALNNQADVIGRSLITKSAISSWKSLDTKSYNWDTGEWYTFDGGAWCAASKELVAYYMDPRNFLDETYIWMFEQLSYQSEFQTIDKLEMILKGTFMQAGTNLVVNDETNVESNYADILMIAAEKSGVSPFYLASSILIEMGNAGASGSISGTVSGYEGYYNYYNWKAYAHSGNTAIVNGLIFAKTTNEKYFQPWNTRYKAIIGGAKMFGENYINIGQDTLYYKKFDYVGAPYTHQYMTHIKAHASEAYKTAKAYTDDVKVGTSIVFRIPVYKNMPQTACPLPTGDGSPNNCLSTLAINGYSLTPTFSKFTTEYSLVVDNSVSSVEVTAAAIISSTKVAGTGTHQLNEGTNTITVTATAENGSVRTYTIEIVRRTSGSTGDDSGDTSTGGSTTQPPTTQPPTTQPPTTETPTTPVLNVQTTLPKNDTASTVNGITPGSTVADIKSKFTVTGGTVEITNSSGSVKTEGKIATGDKVVIKDKSGNVKYSYNVVIYGDVNGDGATNFLDLLVIQKNILGIGTVEGIYQVAGDINRDGRSSNMLDLLQIQMQILKMSTIKQD